MLVGWFDRFLNLLAILAGLMLVALTILICLDVTARYFRLFAMPWSLDVAKYLLYGITFFGAPWLLRDGGHITIDLFITGLSSNARRKVQTISYYFGAVVSLVLTFYACRIVYTSWSQKVMINETFVFPGWYLFALAPPIFLILFLTFVRLQFGGEVPKPDHDEIPGGF